MSYLGKDEKNLLVNGLIYSNFNYWPFCWSFLGAKPITKFENLQKTAVCFALNQQSKS